MFVKENPDRKKKKKSREGVTQGDPTVMGAYALDSTHLFCCS